jgi:hypothetical protein
MTAERFIARSLQDRFLEACEQLWPGAMLVERPNQEEKDC